MHFLSPQELATKTGLLYRLRLFEAVGDKGAKEQLLLTTASDDGEFYFAAHNGISRTIKLTNA